MSDDPELVARRGAYAREVLKIATIENARLEAAFATVPREKFVGPGPWMMADGPDASRLTPDADPIRVYEDAVIALIETKGLNNGQPSFLSMLIDACGVRSNDLVVHIGTGTGYYTAILAHLAGPQGRVLGIEVEPALAERAAANLTTANIEIVAANGWTFPLGPADAILVNAGTPRLAETWLDALKPGGRLVCPLCVREKLGDATLTKGIIFRIERDAEGYAARALSGTSIYACAGSGDEAAEARLTAALGRGDAHRVRRLRRGEDIAEARCWLRGDAWSLCFD